MGLVSSISPPPRLGLPPPRLNLDVLSHQSAGGHLRHEGAGNLRDPHREAPAPAGNTGRQDDPRDRRRCHDGQLPVA